MPTPPIRFLLAISPVAPIVVLFYGFLPVPAGDDKTTVTERKTPGKNVTAPKHTLVQSDGTPIVGAMVYPVRFTQDRRWVGRPTVSGSDGTFSLSDATARDVIIISNAQARISRAVPFFGHLGKRDVPVRVARPASVSLRVRFLDGNDRPLSGRDVMVFPVALTPEPGKNADQRAADKVTPFVVGTYFPGGPSEIKYALTVQTDSMGTALFDALPEGECVTLTVDAASEGHPPLILAGSVLLTAEPAPVVTVRLPLNGTITGQVRHPQIGKPVPGARVALLEPGFGGGVCPIGPKSDREGRFRFTRLYPAKYVLAFEGIETASGWGRYAQTEPSTVMLAPQGHDGKEAEFTVLRDVLVAEQARVDVSVRDGKGRPVFAQLVTLDREDGGGGGLTDINGRVTLYDLPGRYRLTRARRESRPITLAEGEHRNVAFGAKPKKGEHSLRAMAPDFSCRDDTGKVIRLSRFCGKVVTLDFVSLSEDAYSVNALRHAESVARRVDASRTVFLAVCTNHGPDAQERGWFAGEIVSRKAQFPHVRFVEDGGVGSGEEKPSARYHISGWPQRFVIGPDGTLWNAYGSSFYGSESDDYDAINDRMRLQNDIDRAENP